MKLRNVPFSPPDMTEAEAEEVKQAILSGWITTGPRTKKLEKLVAHYVGVNDSLEVQNPNCVCLNSQTACAEMALRLLGIGKGDEVIVPAYTYTASASIVDHVGAKIVFVDVQKDCLEMNYEAVEAVVTERTKAIMASVEKEVAKLENMGKPAIIMTSPIVRMYFKKLTEDYFKDLTVLSYNEVESNVELQSVGMVTI